MRGPIDVSAVIINYHGADWTMKCVASVLGCPDAASREVIVIDNGSDDGIRADLAERFPQVRVVLNNENIGYSRAGNQGRRLAQGRYIMTLDNDAVVLPGALDALVEYLDQHADVAMVSPRLLNPDMTDQATGRAFPTALHGLFGRKTLLTRLFPRNEISRKYLISANNRGEEPFDVDWVSTACVLARAEIVRAIEMDEQFFVYWVDADWCHMIKDAHWRIVCVPAARAVHDEHRGKGHTGRRAARSIVDFHRGAYRYYRKHHIRSRFTPLNAIAIAGLSLRTTLLLAQNALRKA
jgi:N-acetylglucosaminyl-diphospho-decaprenol L-rhamnosyltransferase